MEIIKVVHADTDEAIESNKQAFALENYKFKVSDFVDKFDSEKQLVESIVESIAHFPGVQSYMRFVAKFAGGGAENNINLLNIKKSLAKHFAEKVSSSVVKDIKNQIQSVRVISLEDAKTRYIRTNNLSVGTYTLHPYDSKRLTRLESYHTNLAMEKDDELVIILGRMGAKTIRIVELDSTSRAGGVALGANVAPMDLSAKASIKSVSALGNELTVSFAGNNVEIEENILRTSLWFQTDSKLNSILDSRRFNPNRIEQYTLTSTYRETFDFDFDLAARFLTQNIDAKAQYQALSRKERLFHVEFSR